MTEFERLVFWAGYAFPIASLLVSGLIALCFTYAKARTFPNRWRFVVACLVLEGGVLLPLFVVGLPLAFLQIYIEPQLDIAGKGLFPTMPDWGTTAFDYLLIALGIAYALAVPAWLRPRWPRIGAAMGWIEAPQPHLPPHPRHP